MACRPSCARSAHRSCRRRSTHQRRSIPSLPRGSPLPGKASGGVVEILGEGIAGLAHIEGSGRHPGAGVTADDAAHQVRDPGTRIDLACAAGLKRVGSHHDLGGDSVGAGVPHHQRLGDVAPGVGSP